MKSLTWILLLCFLNFSLCGYTTFVPYGTKTILSDGRGYIDLSDFSGYYRIWVEVTVRNGYFLGNYFYVGGSLFTPSSYSSYTTPTSFYYDDYEHGSSTGGIYSYYTYYFSIPKDGYWDYYLFDCPSFDGQYVEVTFTTTGIPVAVVWVLCILFIAIVAGIAFFFRYKKRQQLATYNQPIQVTQPMVVAQPQPNPGYDYNPNMGTYAPPAQPTYPPPTMY